MTTPDMEHAEQAAKEAAETPAPLDPEQEQLLAEFLGYTPQESAEVPEGYRSGFVAVVGRTNVGKSTFINTALRQKVSIVSPKPQTTRRRIRAIVTRPDAQIVFVDTPGIHKPVTKLSEFMLEEAYDALNDVDVIVFMVEATTPPRDQDRELAARIRASGKPTILVINKADQIDISIAKERAEQYLALGEFQEWFLTSVLDPENVDKILDAIVAHLPPGPPLYPVEQVTDITERELAAELVREAALHILREEVPHSIEVQVEEFRERPNGVIYIAATIFVERDSQKKIVIGRGGEMLKRIGAAARQEIEAALGTRVYLELWVKVRKKWRHDEAWLNRWGYKVKRKKKR